MMEVTTIIHRKNGRITGCTIMDNRPTSTTYGMQVDLPITKFGFEQSAHDPGEATITLVGMRVRFDEEDD